MNEWISIKEQLPELSQWVLVFCVSDCKEVEASPNIFVAYRGAFNREDDYESAYGDGYIPDDIIITHWMPLPMPPTEHSN